MVKMLENGEEPLFNFSIMASSPDTYDHVNETYLEYAERPRDIRLDYYPIVVPIMILLCILGVLANMFILATSRWLKKPPSPVMVLTISLAAADGCVAFFNLVCIFLTSFLGFVMRIETFYTYTTFCLNLTLEAFRMGMMLTAIFHLFSIALNHYAGSLRPLLYQVTVTKPILRTLLCALWTIPTFGFLLLFVSVPGEAYLSPGCFLLDFLQAFCFRFVVFLLVTMPLLLMCGIYTHIFIIMYKRRKNSSVSESLRRGSAGRRQMRNRKAIVTTSLILGTYILGWVPSILTFLLICRENCPIRLEQIRESYPLPYLWLRISVKTLIILKTLVNPVVYALRVQEIQVAIRRMNAYWWRCRKVSFDLSEEDMRMRGSSVSRPFSMMNGTNGTNHRDSVKMRKMSLSSPATFATRQAAIRNQISENTNRKRSNTVSFNAKYSLVALDEKGVQL